MYKIHLILGIKYHVIKLNVIVKSSFRMFKK